MANLIWAILLLLPLCYAHNTALESQRDVTVSYTLWVGPLPTNNIFITAPRNTTFYDVMKIAAATNNHYKFYAKQYDFGHYITQIGNFPEIPNIMSWMIYKLPQIPNIRDPPTEDFLSPVGVDEIRINNDEHYLFWLQKLNDAHPTLH